MTKEKIIIYLLLIFLMYLFCKWILKIMKLTPKDADRSISDIDNMSGIEFEHFVAAVLGGCGFKVEQITQASCDYGADIIVSFNNVRIAVQCKRYKGQVGVKAVQEVISAMKHYDCEEAIVITNSYFTKQAQILAADHEGVFLWNRNKLIQMKNQAIN